MDCINCQCDCEENCRVIRTPQGLIFYFHGETRPTLSYKACHGRAFGN